MIFLGDQQKIITYHTFDLQYSSFHRHAMLALRAKTPQFAVHVHPDLERCHDDSTVRHPPRLWCGQRKKGTKETTVIITIIAREEKGERNEETHQNCLENAAKGSEHVFVSQRQTRDRQAPARPLLRVRRAEICIKMQLGYAATTRNSIQGRMFTDRVLGVAPGEVYRPLWGVAYPPHRVAHAQCHPRAPKMPLFRPANFFNWIVFYQFPWIKNEEMRKWGIGSHTPFWNWVRRSRRRRSNSPDFLNLEFQ